MAYRLSPLAAQIEKEAQHIEKLNETSGPQGRREPFVFSMQETVFSIGPAPRP
jgi:hypothetical protein